MTTRPQNFRSESRQVALAFDGLISTINLLKTTPGASHLHRKLDSLAGLAGTVSKEFRLWTQTDGDRRFDLEALLRIHCENLCHRGGQVASQVRAMAQQAAEGDGNGADGLEFLADIVDRQTQLLESYIGMPIILRRLREKQSD